MKDIVIFGAGGLGKEVAWLIENINNKKPTWRICGFLVDNAYKNIWGKLIYGYKVLGDETYLSSNINEIYVVCAIGKSTTRKLINEKLVKLPKVKLATLIDPSVRVEKTVNIGDGSIICCNCTITVDINIGKGVLMNTGTSIGHDSVIGDYCTFFTNSVASGNTTMGSCCEIGSGAIIIEKKTIAGNTIIAPLSSVLKDIIEPGIYSGNPARRMIKTT